MAVPGIEAGRYLVADRIPRGSIFYKSVVLILGAPFSCACVRACVDVRACACMRVHARLCVHVCMCACV